MPYCTMLRFVALLPVISGNAGFASCFAVYLLGGLAYSPMSEYDAI
jgi:hypothetical protein